MSSGLSIAALVVALTGFLVGLWILGTRPELWPVVLIVAVLGCWGAAWLLGRMEDKPGEGEG